MPRGKTWLLDLVKDVCASATVGDGDDKKPIRIVTPHGLRVTNATLQRVVLGKSVQQIAAALGHADAGQTATQHYIAAPRRTSSLRLVPNTGATKGDTAKAGS